MYMKRKNGFTLVELLAVIVVLAIIIAIAVPIYGKVSKSIAQKQYKNKLELIKAASLKYTDDTNYVAFYVKDLLDDGYLDADEGGHIVSNLDGTIMDCFPISITDDTGVKYAEITESDHKLNNECDYNYLLTANNYIEIVVKDKSGNEVSLNNDTSWFNTEEVQFSLNKKAGVEFLTIPKWYVGTTSSTYEETEVFKINTAHSVKNEIYKVSVKIKKGTLEKEIDAFFVINVDHVNPYFKSTDKRESLNNSWSKEKSYIPAGADNESGYYGYRVIKTAVFDEINNVLTPTNETCGTDQGLYTLGKTPYSITENGYYRVCIMDNVGNVNNGFTNGIEPSNTDSEGYKKGNVIIVDKIDKLPPLCNKRTVLCKNSGSNTTYECSGSSTQTVWSNGSVTALIPCDDQEQYKIDGTKEVGSGCKKDRYEAQVHANGDSYYAEATLYDKAGNQTLTPCRRDDVKINVDSEAPSLSVSVPNATTYAKSKTATVKIEDTKSGLKKGSYDISYAWGTSDVACNSQTNKATISVSNDGQKTATTNITISSKTGAGSIYICNKSAIPDLAGNTVAANTKKSANMYLDNEAPIISTIKHTAIKTYSKDHKITVAVTEPYSGLKDAKYLWQEGSSIPIDFSRYAVGTHLSVSGSGASSSVTGSGVTGTNWYLLIYAEDSLGNNTTIKEGPYYFDNTPPTTPSLTYTTYDCKNSKDDNKSYTQNTWTNCKVKVTPSSTDANVGGVYYQAIQGGPYEKTVDDEYDTYSENSLKKRNNLSITKQGVSIIQFRACDSLGNCSTYLKPKVIKIDKTAPKVIWDMVVDNGNYKLNALCEDKKISTNDTEAMKANEYFNQFLTQYEVAYYTFKNITGYNADILESRHQKEYIMKKLGFNYQSGLAGYKLKKKDGKWSALKTNTDGKWKSNYDWALTNKANGKKEIKCIDNANNETESSKEYTYDTCISADCQGGMVNVTNTETYRCATGHQEYQGYEGQCPNGGSNFVGTGTGLGVCTATTYGTCSRTTTNSQYDACVATVCRDGYRIK